MTAVLVDKLQRKGHTYSEKFEWICREQEPFTFDKDGKPVLASAIVMYSTTRIMPIDAYRCRQSVVIGWSKG